ncbi:hypothetical protein BX661DRAFT_42060 [Kickxella alabastrina]|uniref:uncharacterized protein n=1 Tax=Kickxella alabastrina TaxID=61397 RepID=UPI00221EF4BF|nr:uncharacterized protein BX661DRAFT_42060 [Kickxella alabastrina]KAI7824980.1 hypothetical protein BX661DRAFT_42060 [Kickxella alabastrina]
MVRISVMLGISLLVFWITVLGTSSSLTHNWRSSNSNKKSLSSSQVFELFLWSRAANNNSGNNREPHQSHSKSLATLPLFVRPVAKIENSSGSKASASNSHNRVQAQSKPMSSLLHHRATASMWYSGGSSGSRPTSVMAEDTDTVGLYFALTKHDMDNVVLKEDRGVTSMIAISTVLLFATFVAF